MARDQYSNWVEEEKYKKYLLQASLRINAALYDLRLYGQGYLCDLVANYFMTIMEEFGQKVRGKDVPYSNPPEVYNADD